MLVRIGTVTLKGQRTADADKRRLAGYKSGRSRPRRARAEHRRGPQIERGLRCDELVGRHAADTGKGWVEPEKVETVEIGMQVMRVRCHGAACGAGRGDSRCGRRCVRKGRCRKERAACAARQRCGAAPQRLSLPRDERLKDCELAQVGLSRGLERLRVRWRLFGRETARKRRERRQLGQNRRGTRNKSKGCWKMQGGRRGGRCEWRERRSVKVGLKGIGYGGRLDEIFLCGDSRNTSIPSSQGTSGRTWTRYSLRRWRCRGESASGAAVLHSTEAGGAMA